MTVTHVFRTRCPVCGKSVGLRRSRQIYKHAGPTTDHRPDHPEHIRCWGSGLTLEKAAAMVVQRNLSKREVAGD